MNSEILVNESFSYLGEGMRKDSEVMVDRHFPSFNRAGCCQSTETKHKALNKIGDKRFLHKINDKLLMI